MSLNSLIFRVGAILFDLDGTLVDSTASVGRIWSVWARHHNLDPDWVIEQAHGRRSIETIQLCAPWLDAEAETERMESLEIDDTQELTVIPGTLELLRSLPAHRWGIVTSGTRPLATSRIRNAGLSEPRVLVTATEVKEGKPSPEPYIRGSQLVGFAPQQCLVFEDTPAGIGSARNAGMQAVGLTTTYAVEQLEGATAVIPDLRSIRVTLQDGLLEVHVASAKTVSALGS